MYDRGISVAECYHCRTPHQEMNLEAVEPLDFVVVRSNNQRIAIKLNGTIAENPERLY